jgi:hypothetical protein
MGEHGREGPDLRPASSEGRPRSPRRRRRRPQVEADVLIAVLAEVLTAGTRGAGVEEEAERLAREIVEARQPRDE